MKVRRKILTQSDSGSNFEEVQRIGNSLFEFLSSDTAEIAFYKANRPGTSSAIVQNVFIEEAESLGFKSEKKGLFSDIPTSNLRPDYYMPLGDNDGIIIEVERGKTLMNNMDMLDMWKCHLCSSASHLFLFVPNELSHNKNTKPYDCFTRCIDRLSPFFVSANYTNVKSLWIFGY